MAEGISNSINYVEIEKNINEGVYSVEKPLGKNRSEVWKTLLVVYDENKAVVKGVIYCPSCRKTIKYTSGGTSNLLWHIRKCKEFSINTDTTKVIQAEQNGIK